MTTIYGDGVGLSREEDGIPEFFKCDGDFDAIRSLGGVKIDVWAFVGRRHCGNLLGQLQDARTHMRET